MGYRSLFCYAWDLAEVGTKAAAEDFAGKGINTITLATAYHAGKFLRPHGKAGKVFFPEDGTVYFNTDDARYGTIKPQPNSLLDEHDILAECCALETMDVTAWLVLMHNSALGEAYPQSCVQNAFGDRYIYSLCPSNPDNRHYAKALCTEITENYGVNGITLETPGFLPYQHGYHHEFALVKQNAWLDHMLGLCFCDHCVEQAGEAGIDAGALKSATAKSIEDYLSSDIDYPDDMATAFQMADIAMDEQHTSFLRWRCEQVTSLVRDIRRAVRADASVSVIPSVARPTAGTWYEGSDLAALAQVADYVEACFYEPDVNRINCDLFDIARRIGGTEKLRGILRPGHPDLTSRSEVVEAVRVLEEGGVGGISFYNYGHLRKCSLDWMGSALSGTGA